MGLIDRLAGRAAVAAQEVASIGRAVAHEVTTATVATGTSRTAAEIVNSLKPVKLVQLRITALAGELRTVGQQLEQIARAEGPEAAGRFRPRYDRMEQQLAELVVEHDARLLEHATFTGRPESIDQGTRDLIEQMRVASTPAQVVSLPITPTGRSPLEVRLDAPLHEQPPIRRPQIDMTPHPRPGFDIGGPTPRGVSGLVGDTAPSHEQTLARYDDLMGTAVSRPRPQVTADPRTGHTITPDTRSGLSALVDSTRPTPGPSVAPASVPSRGGVRDILERDLSALGDIRSGDQRIDDAMERLRRNPPKPGDGVGPSIVVVDNMAGRKIHYDV